MGRPKGSRNKPQIEETPVQEETVLEDSELLGETPKKPKKPLGYHPVTGEEVWE